MHHDIISERSQALAGAHATSLVRVCVCVRLHRCLWIKWTLINWVGRADEYFKPSEDDLLPGKSSFPPLSRLTGRKRRLLVFFSLIFLDLLFTFFSLYESQWQRV